MKVYEYLNNLEREQGIKVSTVETIETETRSTSGSRDSLLVLSNIHINILPNYFGHYRIINKQILKRFFNPAVRTAKDDSAISPKTKIKNCRNCFNYPTCNARSSLHKRLFIGITGILSSILKFSSR